MKIVIDIPEYIYEHIKEVYEHSHTVEATYSYIYNGTPLPKGHGRLIDISDIEWARHREERNYIDYDVVDWDDIVNAPTIIEADIN